MSYVDDEEKELIRSICSFARSPGNRTYSCRRSKNLEDILDASPDHEEWTWKEESRKRTDQRRRTHRSRASRRASSGFLFLLRMKIERSLRRRVLLDTLLCLHLCLGRGRIGARVEEFESSKNAYLATRLDASLLLSPSHSSFPSQVTPNQS